MKILQIMAGKALGGAETYSADMIQSLHEVGVDQCVVMSRYAPRLPGLANIGIKTAEHVVDVPFRFWKSYRLRKLINEYQPDLIHCWMRRAASLAPKHANMPIIGWFGGYYNPANFDKCNEFVGVTKDIVAHTIQNGVPAQHAHFIPTFPTILKSPPLERSMFDTPEDVPLILALSRLHIKKGLDTLIKAVSTIPQAYLWLAGEGPLRKDLEQLVSRLDLSSRVKFLGWRNDRSALLAAADICALPSRYEPFGTVILEAWAARTPLVACNSAGPAAHVNDHVNGMLVPIDDVAALAKALQEVIESKELTESLIASGYETYSTTYKKDIVTKQMVALYEKLIRFYQSRPSV